MSRRSFSDDGRPPQSDHREPLISVGTLAAPTMFRIHRERNYQEGIMMEEAKLRCKACNGPLQLERA